MAPLFFSNTLRRTFSILLSFYFLLGCIHPIFGQYDEDALYIKAIHDFSMTKSECYSNLDKLCDQAPARLAGSENYDKAALLMKSILETYDFDTVYTQDAEVQVWNRGPKEKLFITTAKGKTEVNALSLGNSLGTGMDIWAEGEIIEVKTLDEVRTLGTAKIKDKIVFFNRPMDPTALNTFYAYSSAVDQRGSGASVAAEFGAKAVLVRSMNLTIDDFPHTGSVRYNPDFPSIPAMAISTLDANWLSEILQSSTATAALQNNPTFLPNKIVHNVIGEWKGTTQPEKIIVVGGHLDSWDVGEGAHDDGSGCVQALQVLHTLKNMGYKPNHTLRVILYANEENGLSGGNAYARISNEKKEKHVFALESDSGGFSPRAFSFDADASVLTSYLQKVNTWLPIFEPYGIQFTIGGSGADIGPLKSQKGLLAGLRPDSQRYFGYHHTENDTFEAVNKRELELGAAAMTSLVYLIDKYGL